MKFVLREKFNQNLELRAALLETGNDELIENTQTASSKNQDAF